MWRDISARYRQSIVGLGWAIIKPVMTMLIFTFVFGTVAKLDSGDAPYALFCFAAILPWGYFSGALSGSTNSLVTGRGLLTKVYFPRVILPLTAVVTGMVDLLIQFVLLAGLMVYYQVVPTAAILMLPLFLLLAVITAFTGGLWLTVLNVKYRDVGHAVPFMVQSWMWLSPVVYQSQEIRNSETLGHLWSLYALNPLVSVIDGFRWSIFGAEMPDWNMMMISTALVFVLLFLGLIYFRKMESTFADVI